LITLRRIINALRKTAYPENSCEHIGKRY